MKKVLNKNSKRNNYLISFTIFITFSFFFFNKKVQKLDFNIIFYNTGDLLFGNSIIIYFYGIFILGSLFIFLFLKDYLKKIFIFGVFLYFLLFLNNLINYGHITIKGLIDFNLSNTSKFYGYSDDYIIFTQKVRKYLNLDNYSKNKKCDIYIFSNNNTLENYWKLVYLRPCNITNYIERADYIIYYKKEIPDILISKIVMSYNNNYLIKMK